MRFSICDFRFATCVAMVAVASIGGCITSPQNPAATQPATAIDPARAQPQYWLGADQPPVVTVSSDDFHRLWHAAEEVARAHQFKLDRLDYRNGLLTTQPRISPQFFEVWRSDAGGAEAWVESSLATIRRSIHFNFARDDNGVVTVSPMVLVERYSQPERRITSVVQYRTSISPGAVAAGGSREQDAGLDVPARPYWYAIGRDERLEKQLASEIQKHASLSRSPQEEGENEGASSSSSSAAATAAAAAAAAGRHEAK